MGDVAFSISADDQASPAILAAREALSGLGIAAGAVTSGLSAVYSTYALGVKRIIDDADNLNDLSKKIGIGVAQLSSYKMIAEQSGASLDQVGRGIKSLSAAMLSHGAAFKAAGIDTRDADKAFRQLADTFSAMPDGLQKTALAMKLFGREGMTLIPLLNEGSRGLDESARKSAKYAEAMGRLAPKADELKDKHTELEIALKTLYANTALLVVPKLTEIASTMAFAANESGMLTAAWVGFGGVVDALTPKMSKLAAEWEKFKFFGKSQTTSEALAAAQSELRDRESSLLNQMPAWLVPGKIANDARQRQLREAISGLKELQAEELASSNAASYSNEGRRSTYQQMATVATGSIKQISEEEKRYQALLKAFGEKGKKSGVDQEAAALESLELRLIGASEQFSEFDKAVEKVTTGAWKSYSAVSKANLLAVAGEIDEVREAKKAWDEFDKATEEYLKHREALEKERAADIAAIAHEADSLLVKAAAAEEENLRIGMSAEGLAELTRKRYDEQIAVKQARIEMLRGVEGREGEVYALEQQIAALGRLRDAEVSRPKLQEQAQAWENFARDIEQALTDSLYRSFEAGKGFGETFAKSLKNTFKSMVLKFAVQATIGGAGQALGLQTSAGAASAWNTLSGNNWSGASNLASLWNGYGNTMGPPVEGSFADYASYLNGVPIGGMLSAYSMGGVKGFAAGVGSTALAGGIGGMASGAGFMSGAGGALAGLGPYGWAALAAAAILGMNQSGGTPHAGGSAYSSGNGYATPSTEAGIRAYYADSGAADQMVMKDWTKRFSQSTADALGTAAEGFAKTFNAIAKANGLTGGYQFGLAFSADGEDPVRARSAILDAMGKQLAWTKDYNKLGSDPQKGMELMMTEQVPKLMLTALRDLDLGKTLNEFFDASLTSEGDLLQNLTQAQTSAMLELMSSGTLDDVIDRMHLTRMSFADVAASVTNFLPAMQQAEQAFQDAAAKIAEIKTSTNQMFSDSIRSIKLDVLDNQGKYAFYDQEAARYRDVLASLTDAALIQQYAQKLDATYTASWGVLDDTQRQASVDKYEKLFAEAQQLTDDRLAAAEQSAADERMKWAEAVGAAINQSMDQAAAKIAAAIPARIDVGVNVSGNLAAQSEVVAY